MSHIVYNNNYFDEIIDSNLLGLEKVKILFEHGYDYGVFRSDSSINVKILERMFKISITILSIL